MSHGVDDPNEVIGAATCDECRVRIKVLKKNESLIGKAVRCPKCRALFTLNLDIPSSAEQHAIQAEEERTKETKRKKRSKDQIRGEHIERALDGFRLLHPRLKEISQNPSSSEEQVRVWCIDAIRSALGYRDEEIDTECRVLSGRVDIAIKKDNRILIVVECKNIRSRLGGSVRDQGGAYAATLSAEWMVVTNGDLWKLYRVVPRNGQEPKLELIFDISLLDEDGISDRDAENLYLLTSRAMTCGDTQKVYHNVCCLSSLRLRSALFSERVVKAMRLELLQTYQEESQVRLSLDDEEILEALKDEFELSEL